MKRFLKLFRRNRVQPVIEEQIQEIPPRLTNYTIRQLDTQIRDIREQINQLEEEKRRQLRVADLNQDEAEIQRIYAEFSREIEENRRILNDWINERALANQPFEGSGIKIKKKIHKGQGLKVKDLRDLLNASYLKL